jgi:hypothetical protein
MLNVKGIFTLAALCSALSGCYVMPAQSYPAANPQFQTPVAAAPLVAPRPVYTARLYPVNDIAASMGRITGTISNPERGHGEFSFLLGNESYAGEATRAPNSAKGSANAAGNRSGYVKCDYTMTSAALGTGTCAFSNGARYDLHVSL